MGRSYVACYWSVLEWPEWFRTRHHFGWLEFAFVSVSEMKKFGMTESELAKEMLKIFWGQREEQWNMSKTGVQLKTAGDRTAMFYFDFGGFLGDAKAHSEVYDHKGATSKKPCLSCLNVQGRVDRDGLHPYFVHLHDPDFSRCQLCTRQNYEEMVAEVEQAHAEGNPTTIGRVEMSTGLTYNRHGLLYDRDMFLVARVPYGIYWDPQHAYFASGGVAQYQVNQFVLVLMRRGVTLASLDAFVQTITIPRGACKLQSNFFSTRIVVEKGAKKHIRAFASETVTAIRILGYYSDTIVKPTGELADHTRSLDCLRMITDIVLSGERALGKLELLKQLQREHTQTFARLYVRCVKNKPHTTWHIPLSMEAFGKNLNCFGPERKHRASKSIAAFTYRGMTKSLIARAMHAHLRDVSNEHLFEPVVLSPPIKSAPTIAEMFQAWGPVANVFTGTSLCTPNGKFVKHDVLLWRHEHDATLCAGQAQLFMRVVLTGGVVRHAALLHQYGHEVGPVFSLSQISTVLVDAATIISAAPVQIDGCHVKVLLPTVF